MMTLKKGLIGMCYFNYLENSVRVVDNSSDLA